MAITFVSEGYISTRRVLEYLMISERKPDALQEHDISNGISKKSKEIILNGHIEKPSRKHLVRRFHYLDVPKKRIVMQNSTAQ